MLLSTTVTATASTETLTNEIEDILQDEIISTADGKFQCYLVHWRGCPNSDCTLVRTKELQQLDSNLLAEYHHYHSPEANIFDPGRVDGDPTRT